MGLYRYDKTPYVEKYSCVPLYHGNLQYYRASKVETETWTSEPLIPLGQQPLSPQAWDEGLFLTGFEMRECKKETGL